MSEFEVVVVALLLLAMAFVVYPLLISRVSERPSRGQINTALFTSRLAELEKDYQQGEIEQQEFQRLKIELQRRLLEDSNTEQHGEQLMQTPDGMHAWKLLLVLVLLIPLSAWLIYQQIGAKPDWEIATMLQQARMADAKGGRDASDIARKLTDKLSSRLKQKPDDPHYLMLLASTHMSLQNYGAATDAYERMVKLVPNDAGVLAQYAQALYLSANRQMTEQVSALVSRALQIAPNQPTVLSMLGIHAFEQGDYQAAIDYWQRLLPSLGPVSPNAIMIRQGIEQARQLLGDNAQSGAQLSATRDEPALTNPASLTIDVSIADGLNAPADAVVFVYARAVAGPRMPLAVTRLTVADLPASVTLDDSMAMAPELKLSSVDQVEVVARVSKAGSVKPNSGDVEGSVGPVATQNAKGPLALLIDRVLP